MLTDLLLPLSRTDGDEAALDAALRLAALMQARLTALIVVDLPMPVPSEWGPLPVDVYGELHADARARGEALAAQMRDRLAAAQVAHDVRMIEAWPLHGSRIAAHVARHMDLTIVPNAAHRDSRALLEHLFADVLMGSGRPVLAVPSLHAAELPVERAVVAWQPSREASRAVHDALPLLRGASRVDVLVVDPDAEEPPPAQELAAGSEIASHLMRHGLDARLVTRSSGTDTVAAAILQHALHVDAQLIVAGGYSHSRLREQILGGVTRELLRVAHVPVLFAH